MNDLIILANGFDLFYGIKSKYFDFLEFLKKSGNVKFIESVEKYIDSYDLWNSFE